MSQPPDPRESFFTATADATPPPLPDHASHRPTEAEYRDLLQEFSVMVRLDRRDRRQRVAIAVVLGLLVTGVAAFGALLFWQGQQRTALIRDSRAILAVFSLDYQSAVAVALDGENDAGDASPAAEPVARPTQHTVSVLANVLKTVVHRKADASRERRRAAITATAGPVVHLDAAQRRAVERQAREQMAAALPQVGGRTETPVAMRVETTSISAATLRSTCRASLGRLRACAQAVAGDAPFTLRVRVDTAGVVASAEASVDGHANAALSACARQVLQRKSFGPQQVEVEAACRIE
ncbi:MAG: hypothetical protein H6747_13715 [Deltaproteobacteria bacterium]|nr:hypothetical protein [Deltaproteobacteria bacterium]